MRTRTVTVTSKNQITLPSELVRKYNLSKNRVLTIIEAHGSLQLTPQPSLESSLQSIRAKLPKSPTVLTDDDLKAAIRGAIADTYHD